MSSYSPATRRYLLRMALSSGAYVLTLAAVDWASRNGQLPPGPARYLAAGVPILPVAVVIWAMMRFAREEEDEYQRLLHNRAILAALGVTLLACVLWGLMQRYAGAGEVNLMQVFSLYWVSLLATTIWTRLRSQA
jgi:hypothetical protein